MSELDKPQDKPSLNDATPHSKSWLNPEKGVPPIGGFVWGGVSWTPVSGDYVNGREQLSPTTGSIETTP